eukprot:4927102-Amphidinium_carterae.2
MRQLPLLSNNGKSGEAGRKGWLPNFLKACDYSALTNGKCLSGSLKTLQALGTGREAAEANDDDKPL